MKWHQVNLFWADFSHLEPLWAVAAAFNARGHIAIKGLTSLLIRIWVFTIYMPLRFDENFYSFKKDFKKTLKLKHLEFSCLFNFQNIARKNNMMNFNEIEWKFLVKSVLIGPGGYRTYYNFNMTFSAKNFFYHLHKN